MENLCTQMKSLLEQLWSTSQSYLSQYPADRLQIFTEALTSKISEETNLSLTATPSPEEIHLALLAIHPDKVPGPDGLSASFFQAN